MISKKVLILENDLLMSAGLENILLGREDLEVYGVKYSNMGELGEAIQRIQPDIIIVSKASVSNNSGGVLDIMAMRPGVKTILINLEVNQIEILDNKHIRIKDLGDFLSAI